MKNFNVLTRRDFLSWTGKAGVAAAFSSLLDIPLVARRALAAENNLGRNGKKVLFIFLRGANDALNSVIPVQDPAYYAARPVASGNTPGIGIPRDPLANYQEAGPADFPLNSGPADPTYNYPYAIRLGNGFMGLHPSLKFLAPLYNSGDLALIHRVGYPDQSRSHFDSQNYWENGNPNNNVANDGIFYRAILESGLAQTSPLTGISFQSSLPLLLRGRQAAMTNLRDPNRYELLGLPNNSFGKSRAEGAVRQSNAMPFPHKSSRDLLSLQYQNMMDTLSIFRDIDFNQTFTDQNNTDNDRIAYNLFPTRNAENGGYAANGNNAAKYVVPTNSYDFFENLKAAAMVLNKTDAIIAGTQLEGFDNHSNQGGVTGTHSNLLRSLGWGLYALKQYFTKHPEKVNWNDLVVVTLSEFGRTTDQNSDIGTDHAEAGLMFVAGGGVKGYNKGNPSGIFAGSTTGNLPWVPGNAAAGGSMYGVKGRYLKRTVDFRSVLGRIIRDHMGATPEQLRRIIPGYAVTTEFLQNGGVSTIDGTRIIGEPAFI